MMHVRMARLDELLASKPWSHECFIPSAESEHKHTLYIDYLRVR